MMLRQNPDIRIERTDVVSPRDEKIQLAAADLMAIPNGSTGGTRHPLHYPAAVHPFDTAQRVANERHTPRHWVPNVGTQRIGVNAGDRVAQRGNGQPSERPPEQRWRGNQTTGEFIAAPR
jgi:hypothetical protein